ncbi:exosortase family protein XrtF [Flavobacterium urocaniciphilum]|uniref:Exosortase family protein XrtF n=1 Tax=Flavobacterium urocaniciphilum TaxID=1299341 RepID=A0A1H9AQJ2_9FLAO|nr:exosortase family protein XrtF [Flavobacterium urocaniciphilum]SEP78929.1 exosortase family protein XrtF [Flavobacterium urocaniciphilum]
MKDIINQHKPFFVFLLKFVLFYLIFTLIYKFYLSQFEVQNNEVDNITKFVAEQTKSVLVAMGKDSDVLKHEFEPSYKILYSNKYLARVVEGCNAISVIILFASFVFAFSSTFKRTFLFIISGSLLIFVLNILRIAFLTIALYNFPKNEHFLHDIVFPIVIYGVVFLLWIIWVLKFSGYAKVTSK